MAIQNLEIQLTSIPVNTDYYLRWYSAPSDVRNMMSQLGDDWISGREANSTYELFNDGTLQIQIVTGPDYNGRRNLQSLKFKNLVDNIEWVVTNNNFGNGLYVALGYDDALQTAYFFAVGKYYYNNSWEEKAYGTLGDTTEKKASLYRAITHAIPVLYNWKPVPAISGELGTFNFSMIKEEAIGTGEVVSGASSDAFERILDTTSYHAFGQNMPAGVETPIMYAGKVDYCTLEHVVVAGVEIYWELKFYMSGSSTPFYTAQLLEGDIEGDCWISFIIDEENEVAKLSNIRRFTDQSPVTWSYNLNTFTDAQMQQMYLWLHAHIEDPENEDESTSNFDNGDEGGDGWEPWIDYDIDETEEPVKSAIDTGFTTMYEVTDTKLKDLARFLWSDSFLNNVKKFFSDPREILIGIMIFPIAGSVAGTETEIKAGGVSTGIMGKKLTSQYKTLDFGYIDMHEESKTFLDYPPNTRASVYLPYCGEHEIDINDVQNKRIKLKYVFDLLTGAVSAHLKVGNSWKYSYGGQCGIQIPTSSEDFGRMYAGILSAGATIGTAIATFATGGMTAPLFVGSAANLLSNNMNMAPNVQYNSGGGGSTGFLNGQTPFLKLELPEPLMAGDKTAHSTQYSFVGKPTYQNLVLGTLSGFTKCLEVHLENVYGATTDEIRDIESALLAGVIMQSEKERPSSTPATAGNTVISFLKMKSERNVIGKRWKDSDGDIVSVEGKLIYDHSITAPKFLVYGDFSAFNYAYIADFGRFYYVSDIVYHESHCQEISFTSDPLESFAAAIRTSRAVVERQNKKGNLYMTDAYMWSKAKKRICTEYFLGGDASYRNSKGGSTFNRANNTYILTIAGGD